MLEISCSFIALCYPDDLQDHHGREGEQLLSLSIFDGMNLDGLVVEAWDTLNALNGSACDVFKNYSEEQIKEAFREGLHHLISRDYGLNASFLLDIPFEEVEETLEECYLYCCLYWGKPDFENLQD